jgi:hypothetical protein
MLPVRFAEPATKPASLFETGIALMTLPVAIPASLMLAPLAWIWAPGRRPE